VKRVTMVFIILLLRSSTRGTTAKRVRIIIDTEIFFQFQSI